MLSALLAAGCASGGGAAPSAAKPSAEEQRPPCRGTLGFEAGPLTNASRTRLHLPANAAGVLVLSVTKGGPSETAGLRPDDVVERIGDDPVANDCDWSRSAFGRACEPVKLGVRRGEERLQVSVTPMDQDRLLGAACKGGDSQACFRQGWLLWNKDRREPILVFAGEEMAVLVKGVSANLDLQSPAFEQTDSRGYLLRVRRARR